MSTPAPSLEQRFRNATNAAVVRMEPHNPSTDDDEAQKDCYEYWDGVSDAFNAVRVLLHCIDAEDTVNTTRTMEVIETGRADLEGILRRST